MISGLFSQICMEITIEIGLEGLFLGSLVKILRNSLLRHKKPFQKEYAQEDR